MADLPIELSGVAEELEAGSGFWRSCTGCHESNEGHPTGHYSEVFKCHLGLGCRECGGLGAVWDDTDYDAMTTFMMESAYPPAATSGQAAVQEVQPVAWVRVHPDGSYTNEYLPNAVIEDVRKRSGAWVPLAPATSQPSAQTDDALEVLRELIGCVDSYYRLKHLHEMGHGTDHDSTRRRFDEAIDRASKLVKGGAA